MRSRWPAIERDLDRVSLNSHTELLRLAGHDGDIDPGNLPPDTPYDLAASLAILPMIELQMMASNYAP